MAKFTSSNRVPILLITIALIIGVFKIKNALQTEESKIKRVIFAVEAATEREDIMTCMSFLDTRFLDNYGNDRATLGLITQSIFRQYDEIKIAIKNLEINVDETKATVYIEALGLGKYKGTDQLEYNTLKFNVSLEKEEKQWRVIGVEWLEPKGVLSPFMS